MRPKSIFHYSINQFTISQVDLVASGIHVREMYTPYIKKLGFEGVYLILLFLI